MTFYADIGSGSDNWTWMAMLGTGYRFDLCDVWLAVRTLSCNFDGKVILRGRTGLLATVWRTS